ncbi:glycerophosphodiester phosphodiesterase family protein [Jiulongibacter sp. NS-SX5]|uniref:glycerophosphodiester phosphodiesterase family protein n=1 Tax=Jiulongibacter sp. NS-SX5 TaxID=3463854 RepID=UPI0040589F8B
MIIRKTRLICLSVAVFFSLKTSYGQNQQNPPYTNDFFNEVHISVHRGGGFEDNWPENSLESFRHYHELLPTAMIECDVRITRDSVLVLLHDATLERTTTGEGLLNNFTYGQLANIKLEDKNGKIQKQQIPTLKDVLLWADGTVPLTLDIKKETPHHLVIKLLEELGNYPNVVMTTYNTKEVNSIAKLSDEVLISAGIRSKKEYKALLKTGVPNSRLVAFVGTRLPDKKLLKFLNRRGIPTILGSLGKLDKLAEENNDLPYVDWFKAGVQIFATDRPIHANKALMKYIAQ